jgi:hypothetical protein
VAIFRRRISSNRGLSPIRTRRDYARPGSTFNLPGDCPCPLTIFPATVHARSPRPSIELRAQQGAAAPAPGDEAGPYSWMQLEAMDLKFRRALQSAIERGEERVTASLPAGQAGR